MGAPSRLAVRLLALALGTLAATPGAGAADVIVRGSFAHGAGVSLLQPCGSDQGLWVDAFSPAAKDLIRRYEAATERGYQPVYVELKGWTRKRAPEDGIAEEYDAIFSPTEVLAVGEASGGC